MLPATLPLFPLPNVVLFPNVFLPLHIFEPRYRAMVADALDGDRLIGMVLLRPGWEGDYEGRPPVFPIGCAGLISHHEQLPDGRYNIVLRGLEKFRVEREDDSRLYRLGEVITLNEPLPETDRAEVRSARRGSSTNPTRSSRSWTNSWANSSRACASTAPASTRPASPTAAR